MTNSNPANSNSADATDLDTASHQPEPMKKVSIVIAGKTYPINCPVDGEEELRAAAFYINNFIHEIKQDAPNLSPENLLVLCCLNLYEKIHTQQKTDSTQRQLSQEANVLLDKILQDARSILN